MRPASPRRRPCMRPRPAVARSAGGGPGVLPGWLVDLAASNRYWSEQDSLNGFFTGKSDAHHLL